MSKVSGSTPKQIQKLHKSHEQTINEEKHKKTKKRVMKMNEYIEIKNKINYKL